ncbi:hypothetical protein BDZ97DRAFT_1653715 [Flammula alnicola]|nr:hypothetical protein BDZ97DRAFT_1653715 [Flammula alnicola]
MGTLHSIPVSESLPETPDTDLEYASLVLSGAGVGSASTPASSRTMWDILWSCIVTIFACTWSAVHPNIPDPRESGWTCFKRRVVMMFYAMIAPEVMVVWALRQYFGAGKIMRDYNEHIAKAARSWTMAHGFFVQMGGYMLCKDGRPVRTLDYKSLKNLIMDKAIDISTITEVDIKNRSNGDFISKGIVVLQTTWFIIQCIARWSEKLPLTELEVVTLAFAIVNAITYGLWWHKPQNVGVVICVEKKAGTVGDEDGRLDSVGSESDAMIPKVSWLRRKLKKDFEDYVAGQSCMGWWWYFLGGIPLRLVKGVLRPLKKMADDDKMPDGALCVPMFYAQELSVNRFQAVMVVSFAIAILFGLMHLIAWSFDFPSRTEQLLWRISAFIIIAEPACMAWSGLDRLPDWIIVLAFIPAFIGMPLYVIARMVLLTEALLSLRALPPAAYQSIKWTSVIPHL